MKKWYLPAFVAGLAVILALSSARADIPAVRNSAVFVGVGGVLPVINLTGQSTCSMTLQGSGSATIIPHGSSDGGQTYPIIPKIGARSSNGSYGAAMTPYLTNFYVEVALVTGTVMATEVCSSAVGATFAVPSPTATPVAPPTPTPTPSPTPIPTPPTPTPAPTPSPSPTPSNFPGGVLNDGPLAYYRLADGSNPSVVVDSSGNGYNGTSAGTITTAASLLVGDSNAAENFLGGHVVMPSTMTDFHQGKFTIAWLMTLPTSTAGSAIQPAGEYYGIIFGRDRITAGPPATFGLAWGVGAFTTPNANQCGGTAMVQNTTHFVAITFDMTQSPPVVQGSISGGALLNCNATPALTQTQIAAITSPATKQFIGTQVGNSFWNPYQGVTDEVEIYPYILTLTQIQTLDTLSGR